LPNLHRNAPNAVVFVLHAHASCHAVEFALRADAPREETEALCEEVVKRSAVMDEVQNPVPISVVLWGGWDVRTKSIWR